MLGTGIKVSPVESSSPLRGRGAPAVLGERYTLTTRIAVGGMGEVWAATDEVLGRRVAVKILRDSLADSPVFLARFRAEARHTAALAHPGIAGVFDYGEDHEDNVCVAYLVMELVSGESLSNVLAGRGTLPVDVVLSLLAQTAEALHAAHIAGVVHRDVKPGNLLVLDDGTIKVTDFGIARAADSVALTEVGQVIGTARYISPEQALGGTATAASDIYSLGVIGYEMLAGHPPFTADSAGALAMAHAHQPPPLLPETVPGEVAAAIGEALAKDPVDRPSDALAFAATLRRLQLTTMPPPGAAVDLDATALMPEVDEMPPTRVMGATGDTASQTAIMPEGHAVMVSPDLGISQQPHEARRQRRRIGLALLAAVVVVIAIALLSAGRDDQITPTTTAPVATTPTPTVGTVDANALVGLPVAEASTLLTEAGFVVASAPVDALDVPEGVVTGVDPTGEVPIGATVTLDVSNGKVASPPATAPKENGKGKDNTKGKG